jgi:hypothetical protein
MSKIFILRPISRIPPARKNSKLSTYELLTNKRNVKVSRYTPWRSMEGEEV